MSSRGQRYRSWVEIDLDSFRHNWDEINRLVGPGIKVLQVVKADAYGHGAIEISKAAVKNGVYALGVANADEGVQLRVGGIDAPIIILSPSTVHEIDEIIKYDMIPSVSDVHFAVELNRKLIERDARLPVHIEIDTGMGRGGTIYSDAIAMVRSILALSNVVVEGIFSHLSVSEVKDDEYNSLQWKLFEEVVTGLEKEGIHIPIKHISNSGGVLNFPRFNLDMVRPGIMTYGVYPSFDTVPEADLIPVMSFRTRIVILKDLPAGYSIGYGRSHVTKGPARIATIPVGYGDGYGFIMSNQGQVLIRGDRAPIVGRISMDMCTVDVTHIPECEIGDEVVLMGMQGKEYVSAGEIAEKSGTISYEILCALGKRAPRVFVNKGEADTVEPKLRRIFIPGEEKSIARIDNMIRGCLQARTSDMEFADAIYYEMFETLFGRENRQLELRMGFRYDIRISNFPDGEKESRGPDANYFRVTTHIEYIKTLRDKFFIIGCARNDAQLSALFEEEKCEYRWLLNGTDSPFREGDFRVARVRVDGGDVPVINAGNTDRGYEVLCGGDGLEECLNRQVKVEIEIETKKHKSSRMFSVYLAYPTRGMDISFNYEKTGLKNVREVSFFAGRHPYPEIIMDEGKSIELNIGEDEWVFPNSGVTFIWDL
ncbi:MAG: alanine racemase [Deltaproteobacteria bacterium]|nr:alanine racemase [Deltaproteobacteria bacterium]MBW2595064.1 alanine racemase [Deltaproteobacteria bacterium]